MPYASITAIGVTASVSKPVHFRRPVDKNQSGPEAGLMIPGLSNLKKLLTTQLFIITNAIITGLFQIHAVAGILFEYASALIK
jgi:hypothetical protein